MTRWSCKSITFRTYRSPARESTCNKLVDNLQQTCHHQAGANDANASWFDEWKAISLQHTCCNFYISGCVKKQLFEVDAMRYFYYAFYYPHSNVKRYFSCHHSLRNVCGRSFCYIYSKTVELPVFMHLESFIS